MTERDAAASPSRYAGARRLAGKPYPLGATWDGSGVNFALFSEHADGVELCLFDAARTAPRDRRASA